jgi:glyoxylase-like metal-dependent hydrolase (beta-lactamase superfamily II)
VSAGGIRQEQVVAGLRVITIETPSLGDRSYIAHDGTTALVIDPQRDIDRVLHHVEALGLDVAYVFETHVHNDYVTGGYELARRTGATYVLNADDELFFDAHGVRDGDYLSVGGLDVRVHRRLTAVRVGRSYRPDLPRHG